MELDHGLIAVPDLDAAARELETRHGLMSVEGGRHAGWGTANRIVPLGETYTLPFFVEWGEGTPLPGRAPVAHPAGSVRLACAELTGDAPRMADWLGTEAIPIAVTPDDLR